MPKLVHENGYEARNHEHQDEEELVGTRGMEPTADEAKCEPKPWLHIHREVKYPKGQHTAKEQETVSIATMARGETERQRGGFFHLTRQLSVS